MWQYTIIAFRRHEYWAIQTARKVPFFAIFVFATLAIWVIPALPILVLVSLPLGAENLWFAIPGAILNVLAGVVLMILVTPWYFRWAFICMGLMFRRGKMAQDKENELKETLMRLTHD
ncbi:hypothetical protein [Halocynthiibacter sp.]|uniref:hypothetical protein n=1 Tax=Halocynthiibacter sp. TaxID=1979210 RepID=UPI003C4E9B05